MKEKQAPSNRAQRIGSFCIIFGAAATAGASSYALDGSTIGAGMIGTIVAGVTSGIAGNNKLKNTLLPAILSAFIFATGVEGTLSLNPELNAPIVPIVTNE